MTHEQIQALAFEYVRGEVDEATRQEMQEHLRICESCRRYVEEVQSLEHLLMEAPRVSPPPSLRADILQQTVYARRRRFSWRWLPALVPVLAGLLLIFLVLGRGKQPLEATSVTVDLLSPEESAVLFPEDFVVIAAIYPSLPFEAEIWIDSVQVQDHILKGNGYLAVTDLPITPGYHDLWLIVRVPDAQFETRLERTFYILETEEARRP